MSFSAGLELQLGNGATPTEVFTKIPKMISISGLGETAGTIDVTTWDSTAKEYILGLADGQDVTIEANRILSNTTQEALIADVVARKVRNFKLTMTDGAATETFSFALALTSWNITPNHEDKHTLSVNGKISGGITRATV